MYLYQAAVLHDLNGDREKAIVRTQDWLNSLDPADHTTRTKAQAQLAALTGIPQREQTND